MTLQCNQKLFENILRSALHQFFLPFLAFIYATLSSIYVIALILDKELKRKPVCVVES